MKTKLLRLVTIPLLAFSFATQASLTANWPADGNTTDVVGGNDGASTNLSYTIGQIGQALALMALAKSS